MNGDFYPLSLSRDESARSLVIAWNDGRVDRIRYRTLRDGCGCAGCRAKEMEPAKGGASSAGNPLRVLSAAEARPLEIVSMSPVGNYAYHIDFSDGHNTGIFTFDRLRSLAENE